VTFHVGISSRRRQPKDNPCNVQCRPLRAPHQDRHWYAHIAIDNILTTVLNARSQWPRGLRRRSAAARLLGLCVRIPPGAWMSVSCECCVLSGRCLCDELITRPEESYQLWWVVVFDLETSWMRRPWPTGGCRAKNKQTVLHILRTIGHSYSYQKVPSYCSITERHVYSHMQYTKGIKHNDL
jgi:hypothetical protein